MLDRDIYKVLSRKLGHTSLKGFPCLVVAVGILKEEEGFYAFNVTDLYKEIATVLGTTASKVERSIRYYREAVEREINLNAVFGSALPSKYTNKEFIVNAYDMYVNTKELVEV
jgi:hypothetical protein